MGQQKFDWDEGLTEAPAGSTRGLELASLLRVIPHCGEPCVPPLNLHVQQACGEGQTPSFSRRGLSRELSAASILASI